MKTINEFLQENIKPVNFDKELKVEHFYLSEADDIAAGDPMGGATADPMGGATDPMGATDPIGDPMGDAATDPMGGGATDPMGGSDDAGDDAGFDNGETVDEDDEDAEDDHEDDPDWTKGVKDPDDPMLNKKPSGETIYDAESVVKSIAAVKATLPAEQLKSIDAVQKALELIVNGKKLKIDDVAFDDPDDAMELINKIEEPLDIKLKNYIDLKIKQPIIVQRDKNKAEIATLANDNDKAREAIDAMNK